MAMTLRPSDKLDEAMKQQAAAEGVSAQALWSKAGEEYLAGRGKSAKIEAGMAEMNMTFADALRRLGE